MHPTKDGYVYQSRQDTHFDQLEGFADFVFNRLLNAIKDRPLTPEENEIVCMAADVANAAHICRVMARNLPTVGESCISG